METLDLGNNKRISRGMANMGNGEFLVLTFSESKYFKTEKGAVKWLEKRGLNPNGTEK